MTINSSQGICDSLFSARTDPARLDDFDPVVLNIYFWELQLINGDIHPNDYLPNWDFEKESLDVVASLNIRYNPYKIYFKYQGNGGIKNDSLYYNPKRDSLSTAISNIQNNPPNVIVRKDSSYNVYVAPKIDGGMAGVFSTKYIVSRSMFDSNTNASDHEIGHTFGLLHTFHNHRGIVTTTDTSCEHVTRNPNDSLYNADKAGDRVPDTAAAPDFSREVYWDYIDLGYSHDDAMDANIPYYYVNNNCQYTGAPTTAAVPEYRKDCKDSIFDISEADVRNLMAYSPSDCPGGLTMGQGIRAREAVEIDCYGKIVTTRNVDGVASLYEPYKGEYFVAGPLPANPPLFQPGFDYSFVSCDCYAVDDCPVPLDYGETEFSYNVQTGTFIHKEETNYSSITHPNHMAIDIPILNETQPWRCYDNNNRKPNGGTIIKFNDNVFNTNVTITPQDSTSINDENLINNLQPGLYNIIEQFEDGDTEETVIIKENN